MDIVAAYREVGSYRGAAAMCGTTHKTVRRIVEACGGWRQDAGPCGARSQLRSGRELVAERVR